MSSRSVKTATLAFGRGSQAIVQILIIACLSRWLSKPDYATFRQTLLVYTMVAPILALGLPAGVLYFFPKQPTRTRNLLTESFSLLTGIGLLFSVFLLVGGADLIAGLFNNPDLSNALRWFAFYPLFTIPIALFQPVMVASDRVLWVAIHTIASQLIRALVVLMPILLIAQTPLLAIQMYMIFSAMLWLPSIALMFFCADQGDFQPTKVSILEQCRYSFPLGLSSFIGTINMGMDKTVVASMFEKDIFAEFVNGAMEVPFIRFVTGSAAAVLVPEVSRLHGTGEYEKAMALFRRSAVKCGSILIPLAGLLFLTAPQIMTTIYGPEYERSALVFRIYLAILPLRSINYGVLFQSAGRSDLVLTRAILNLLFNTCLTIWLASILGTVGAAVGTLLSLYLFVFPYCIFTCGSLFKTHFWNVLPVSDFLTLLGISLGSLAAAMLAQVFFEPRLGSNFVTCISSSAVYMLICGVFLTRTHYIHNLISPLLTIIGK